MTLDGSGTDLVNGSDLDNECGGGGLGASLSSHGQKTSRYSFPETQEWSHEVKLQIITIISIRDKHMPCLTLFRHHPFANQVWHSLLVVIACVHHGRFESQGFPS